MVKKVFKLIWHVPRNILAGLIFLYQKLLSPDHSFWAKSFHIHGYCKFHPTCSQYMQEALKKYGVFRGLFKGVCRIGRCNPWAKGGIDKP